MSARAVFGITGRLIGAIIVSANVDFVQQFVISLDVCSDSRLADDAEN